MSESVTNVEVEDVLSSIRRLVSDDKRPSVAVISEPSNDRLVLTPALRVAGSDEIADNETDNVPAIQAWSDFAFKNILYFLDFLQRSHSFRLLTQRNNLQSS